MITQLTGRADNYDLVFVRGGDGIWRISVPADLTDGQYAVELTATNDRGEQGYWTGILYINRAGEVCVRLIIDDMTIWLSPDDIAVTDDDDTSMRLSPDDMLLTIDDDITVILGGCRCAGV